MFAELYRPSLITVFNILSMPYILDLVTRYKMPLILPQHYYREKQDKKLNKIIIIQPMLQYKGLNGF